MNCSTCQAALPDLLLDPRSAAARRVRPHLDACVDCRRELTELESAFALLDHFHAPEPSPWFDARLSARMREAQAAPPESLWERLGATLRFSTGRYLRPALAGALALVLLVGGGTAAEFAGAFGHTPEQASATVQDLQILDRNDQTFQTMDQLDQLSDDNNPASPDDSSPDAPVS